MNKVLRHAIAVAGLAVIAWVGAGYLRANPLALAVTALIVVFYVIGVLDLQRFNQSTNALAQALDALPDSGPKLRAWLSTLPASLQNAVRRRVEGEPAGLPGPSLAPSLAGLLVLLGMLGTFLGMVLTLRGTGTALESAADLVAVRDSLIGPVKGLGLAFGTSVAGVAASAALGLLTTLSRRDRAQLGQRLDACVATTLHAFSDAHQAARQAEQTAAEHREASLSLLQRQTELMPALVTQLQAMMTTLERQGEASQARLLANQETFHRHAESAYGGLASSVARTLEDSLTRSARLAAEAIKPVAETTLAGISNETAQLHTALAGSMQAQLDQLATRFEASTTAVAQNWQTLMERHAQSSGDVADGLRASHERFAATFEQRAATLVDDVTARLGATAQQVTDTLSGSLAQHASVSEQLSGATRQSLETAIAAFEQHAAALMRTVQQAHGELQADTAQRDEQRVAAMTQSIEGMAASLRREWQEAGAQTLAQQQRVCDTMERTARDITAQAEAQVRNTSAEIARLVQAAAEAPRAAADVIAELRQKLSDSLAHDNALVEERTRMLDTLGTLLDGVNRAATEQRGAIDALVASTASVLERVGARFGEQVDTEAGKLAEVSAQVASGATHVAGLGEAFGQAVQSFGATSEQLGAQLQRIETALSASLSRSDEQLAYYVAQAREVIDLSMLSQKQIIEDLQRLASRQAAEATA